MSPSLMCFLLLCRALRTVLSNSALQTAPCQSLQAAIPGSALRTASCLALRHPPAPPPCRSLRMAHRLHRCKKHLPQPEAPSTAGSTFRSRKHRTYAGSTKPMPHAVGGSPLKRPATARCRDLCIAAPFHAPLGVATAPCRTSAALQRPDGTQPADGTPRSPPADGSPL